MRKVLQLHFMFLLWLTMPLLTCAQKVFYLPFNETSGVSSTEEKILSESFVIQNNFQRPERIQGVSGNALRFDGWSTWIEAENVTLAQNASTLTVECWYATEAFTAANAGIISQEDAASGFTLEVEPFGKVVFIFWADNTRYVLVTDQVLAKYQWNHIVATVGVEERVARLYVNGAIWKEVSLDVHQQINLSENKLYIGRDTDLQEFAGFPLTMANGAIDELSVYNEALTTEEVVANYNAGADAIVDLNINPQERHAGDHLRPRFHAMPNTSWTNECYGLTYYDGTYHLFFQKNPNGPYLYFMHWGHLTSSDLVNWKEERIALAPTPGFDSFGVWSGTTIKNNAGKPVIFYTGVNGVKAGIGLAEPVDESLIEWKKSEINPIIDGAPADIKNRDFRDPFLWKHNDSYFMIVGSGLQFGGGGYLFTYKSTNLTDWTAIAPLYNDTNIQRSGDFWEMPFFYQLNENDWLLSVTPLPVNGVRAKAVYWIGRFSDEKFHPYDAVPKSLELISDNLLAPAIGTDEAGRITYTGIIPEDRNVDDQVKAGWRHLFSLPRVLRLLKDSTIGQIPHPNLCRLRGAETTIGNIEIGPGSEFNLPDFSGNQVELHFDLKADSATHFSIEVLKNADESEYTSLHFDLEENLVKLDRTFSSTSLTPRDVREAKYIFDHKENINVTVFIDHSVLEVFIDNVVVFSCRVYPAKPESNKIDLVVAKGKVKILSGTEWQMMDIGLSNAVDVCEPDPAELPNELRKEIAVGGPVTSTHPDGEKVISVYPIPATGSVFVEYSSPSAVICLYRINGVLLSTTEISGHEWNISGLGPGIYFVKIISGSTSVVAKLIVE